MLDHRLGHHDLVRLREREALTTPVDDVEQQAHRHPQRPRDQHARVEHRRDDQRDSRGDAAEHREHGYLVAAYVKSDRAAPRAFDLRAPPAQRHHRGVRHREREHRSEGVDHPQEVRLAGQDRDAGDQPEDRDRNVGRAEPRVQDTQDLGQLPVLAHRVGEPRDAEHARVRRDEEDRGREDADVDLRGPLEAAEIHVLDDTQDRIVRVAALLLGLGEQRLAVLDRHRRQRDGRQEGVDHDHRDHDQPHAARDRLAVVARLLGQVRDRLDARVGDHPDGDCDQEVRDGRGGAEVDLVDELLRVEHQRHAHDHEQHLRAEVGDGEEHVDAGRLLHADDVHHSEQDHHDDAAHDVGGRLAERRPEHPEVVRHEEGRDRDRDDVGEHLAPAGEEGPELVEGSPRERRRAARLRVHRGRFRVGGGRAGEDRAGDQEDHRRHAEREDRYQAERVIDRAAHVAVGGREQGSGAENPLEPAILGSVLGHVCLKR